MSTMKILSALEESCRQVDALYKLTSLPLPFLPLLVNQVKHSMLTVLYSSS